MPESSIIRGSVGGRPLYCRIPIRRKRVPMFADQFRDMLDAQREIGLSDDEIRAMSASLWQANDFEHAGLLMSYLDFVEIMKARGQNALTQTDKPDQGGEDNSNV